MGLARRIAIVGVGETRYERRATRDLASLRCEASRAALADAGLAAAAVDGLIVPGSGYAELHELARDLGMRGQFHAASCFHSGTAVVAAPLEAALAIEGGLAHTVLCCQGVAWGSERRGNVGQPHADRVTGEEDAALRVVQADVMLGVAGRVDRGQRPPAAHVDDRAVVEDADPLLGCRQLHIVHPVRHSRSPLVEHNDPRKRSQLTKCPHGQRLLPPHLEVADKGGNQHEVEGTLSKHLVGDVVATALRVVRLRNFHDRLARSE